jgi:hypothetical protein
VSNDLIATARRLAKASPKRPRQSDLKRGVSTAYYALFHALARDCADLLVGTGDTRSEPAWAQVYRTLEHGVAKNSCKAAAARVRNRELREYKAYQAKHAPEPAAIREPDPRPTLIDLRLMRVRKQLDRIDEMMANEDEPQALDRLASAYAKLSEQERILDGRPLPGSHRPTKPKPSKADAGSYGPVE